MRFYELRTSLTDRWSDACTEAFKAPGTKFGDTLQCATCRRTIGMLRWLPPFRAELEARGSQFGDLAFFGVGDSFLVSQRFRDIYIHHHLTGLEGFEPVEIVRVKRKKKSLGNPPTYLRAAVCRGKTALDLTASGFEWIAPPSCPDCLNGTMRSWKRTIVDESTWTGEDIFIPRGLNAFIVSERFKDVCESNGVTNAVFASYVNRLGACQ